MTLKKTWETEGCGKTSHKAIPCTCQKKCHHIYPLPQKAEDEGQVSAWGVETGSQERRGGQMPVGSAMRERKKKASYKPVHYKSHIHNCFQMEGCEKPKQTFPILFEPIRQYRKNMCILWFEGTTF